MVILNWLQIDDCCDLSLKCEFYLDLLVVTSKIISHEQNKAASPVHPFPVAIETLSIPRSLCISRPLSLAPGLCVLLPKYPTGHSWLHVHRSGWIFPSSLSIPFPSPRCGSQQWANGELRPTERPLHRPPQPTWQYCPWHASDSSYTLTGGSCTSHDCLVAFLDPVHRL